MLEDTLKQVQINCSYEDLKGTGCGELYPQADKAKCNHRNDL